MLFWTIVFITYYTLELTNGNLFYNCIIKSSKLSVEQGIEKDIVKKKELGTELLKAVYPLFLIIPLSIIEFFYMISAIRYDVYKYPSIILIFYLILNLVRSQSKNNNKKNINLETEEGRFNFQTNINKNIKKYSFKLAFTSIVFLGYFCYMFTILIR